MGYGVGHMQARNDASATIEARVKPTTLATLAEWMERKGYPARTKSELVRQALEVLEGYVIQNEQTPEYTNTEQALEYLEAIGLGGLNRGSRGRRALLQQLQKEQRLSIQDNCARLPVRQTATTNTLMDVEAEDIYISTQQKLADLGYAKHSDWVGDNTIIGLPPDAVACLKRGQLPPPIWPREEEKIIVPQAPEDRPETLEEAVIRREAEEKRQKQLMKEAVLARRRGQGNGE